MRSAADVTADIVGADVYADIVGIGRVQRQFTGAAPTDTIRDRGIRMTDRFMGQGSKAVRLPLIALALSLAGGAVPALAQDSGTSTPSPSPGSFRLPPAADEGRSPGMQGPSDNGLPPVAPGERRGAQPTPAPTPTPPQVTPTQPTTTATTPAPTPARRDAPASAIERTAPAAAAATPDENPASGTALSPLQTETPAIAPPPGALPPAIDDAAVAAAPAAASSGTPLWAWILAALAALGVGFWYWRRRSALAGPAAEVVERESRPAPLPPAPRAATPPAAPSPAPRPVPAAPRSPAIAGSSGASPLVTRPAGEQRALIGMALYIRSIRFAPDHVAVGLALNLLNQGSLPATGLMVRIALNQGSAMPESVLGRFFDGAGGSVLRDDMVLAPGAGEELSTEVMLPRAAIEPLMIGGKPMLVPVIAFDVTYHWDGKGEAFGQNAGSFVLGRAAAAGAGDKLAPLPLDRASYLVDRPGARATAIKRSQ